MVERFLISTGMQFFRNLLLLLLLLLLTPSLTHSLKHFFHGACFSFLLLLLLRSFVFQIGPFTIDTQSNGWILFPNEKKYSEMIDSCIYSSGRV
jgi:hypothetical protein